MQGKPKYAFIRTLVIIIFTLGIIPVYALDIHVSVNGKNSYNGTALKPLSSIEGAQKALRNSGLVGKETCRIIIHEGIYRLNSPIIINAEDGGTDEFPVVFCASDNDKVVITGAQLITSKWKPWKKGIFRTSVGRLDAIDQLFIDGKRQHMARYPNFGAGFVPSGNDSTVRGKKAGTPPFAGCTPDAWDVNKAAAWKNPKGAIMNGMHGGLWGSQHYYVTGKDETGALVYEGGWQNNRSSTPHRGYRMIENVFEELDAPGEWYHDTIEGCLYYLPTEELDLNDSEIEAVLQIKHLLEIYGDYKQPVDEMDILNSGNGLEKTVVKNYETIKPVKNIQIRGINFTGTKRTLIETREPLLRSDWCIYRGGAIHLRGTENIVINNCGFEELGGNGIFVDSYNRNIKIHGNLFQDNGSTDINLVGSFAAVRNPFFNYKHLALPLGEVDTIIGPQSNDYPEDCIIEDNLMERCGRFEKQACGINISMSSRITVSHNTISHTPRAAINICDGSWGGHIIEWNDCFETVLETDDHGAFNSWGRDRYWYRCGPSGPDLKDENGIALITYYIEKYPNSPFWDAYQTSIIRNNRMQCDHGWDIDLDDGSSNYQIYNNICLSGGLKTREGYRRIVTNNIIMGRGYTCNVPYPKPTEDIFERNVLWGKIIYRAANPLQWGGTRNYNFIHNPELEQILPAYGAQQQTQDDSASIYGNVLFSAPEKADFTVLSSSKALDLGFKNFPMTGFGVTSMKLKKMAKEPPLNAPTSVASNVFVKKKMKRLLGAQIKTLSTDAEVSATGMFEKLGVMLVSVPKDSQLAKLGFRVDDVVIGINSQKIINEQSLIKLFNSLKNGDHQAKVWRNQEARVFEFQK